MERADVSGGGNSMMASTGIMGRARRLDPRDSVRWTAEWRHENKVKQAEIQDISPSGLFLHPTGIMATPPAVGSRVEVDFATPNRRRLMTAGGTVRWVGFSRAH